jgi:hypothetical protein
MNVQEALGDSISIHPESSGFAADRALRSQHVVGVLTQKRGNGLYLEVAGANGISTTNAVKDLVSSYAHSAGKTVTVNDVVPLTSYDRMGLASFYVAFGVTLSGFALSQSLLGQSRLSRVRHRFTVMAGFSVAAGTVAAALAGPILGAVPAPFFPLALTLALLAAAAAFATNLLSAYFGPLGVPVATLVLLTVGNATSGATVGADLLPGLAHAISGVLPPGAAVRAITAMSYFETASTLSQLLILFAWVLGSALLIWGHSAYLAAKGQRGRAEAER